MELKYLEKSEYNLWEEFLEKSEQYSIFSSIEYLESLKAKFNVLVVLENEDIVGGIVLCKDRFGLNSNPLYVKYLGIVFGQFVGKKYKIITKKRRITELIISELKSKRSFFYKFHPNFNDWTPFYWTGYEMSVNYTYRIDLNKDFDEITKKYNSRLRTKINKITRESQFELIENIHPAQFLKINKITFQRQGGKMPISEIKFNHFYQKLNPTKIQLIGLQNKSIKEIVCAACIVVDKRTCYLLMNGFDQENIVDGVNEFFIHMLILLYKKKDIDTFDFEGSMIKSIESFYRKFGGEQTPYFEVWNNSFLVWLKRKSIPIYKKLVYGK